MSTEELINDIEKLIGRFRDNPLVQIRKGVVSQDQDSLALDLEWIASEAGEARLGADYEDEVIGGEAHIRLPLSDRNSTYMLDKIPGETDVQHSPQDKGMLLLTDIVNEERTTLSMTPEEYVFAGIRRLFFYGWQKLYGNGEHSGEEKIKAMLQLLGLPAILQND